MLGGHKIYGPEHKALCLVRCSRQICIGLDRTIYIRCVYGIFGREITKYVGLARTIYIRCVYGIFGRETTKYVGWPELYIRCVYGVFGS